MNVSGQSFEAFVGEATQVVIHPESPQVAVPEPLGRNSIAQFHQDILLMHFTDYTFCQPEEIGLVDERLKHERVNPSRRCEAARFDQLDDAWPSRIPGSTQAEYRYNFFACSKFAGYVSCQKPRIGLPIEQSYEIIK